MLIRYYGHSLFTVETQKGTLLAFDPYDDKVGYALPKLDPEIVLMSHAHMDHGNRALFQGAKQYITKAGRVQATDDVTVTGIMTWHDDQMGEKRGNNMVYKVEADGLSIVHLGDLGHMPTDAQLKQIGKTDILLLPVGGFYTIDAAMARAVMLALDPRVTIPMHYKTEVNATWPISGVEAFTALFASVPPSMPILRVTKEDICCLPPVVVMRRD